MAQTQLPGKQIGPLDLAAEVAGVLPTANGGTGASSIAGAGIVDTSTAQTLTSKTLTSPIINGNPLFSDSNIAIRVDNGTGETTTIAAVTDAGAWSDIASANDAVIRATRNNLVITARNASGAIIFGTGATDSEKMRISNAGVVTVGGVPVVTTTAAQALSAKTATLAAGSTTVAPLVLTSGTNLTTPAAGAVEYDGATFSGTMDTTSGRALNTMDQLFRLTADGTAIGPTIADYFGTNSAFPYVASGVYEIVWYLAYTKTTGGTVTYTITSTTAPVNLNAWYTQNAITGIATLASPVMAGITKSTSAAAALTVTGTQAAAQHIVEIHAIYEAGTAGNLRLRVTQSAGTVTPLRGSFYRVRRLPSGNVGTFVA